MAMVVCEHERCRTVVCTERVESAIYMRDFYPGWVPPELQFLDMGPYGNHRFFENFRTWADNETARRERRNLQRRV